MNFNIITCFLVLLLVLALPQVSAQTDSVNPASQKLVQVTIDDEGNVEVVHQIRNSNEPQELEFVKGTVSNVEFIDKIGRHEPMDVLEGADHIVILPNQGELFVKYDLDDVLILKDGFWTLDFRYLETTTFVIPKEVKLFFINEKPVLLDEKNAFTCHGCQMILEYSIDEPRNIEYVNWEEKKFVVEIISFAEIENFEFSQPAKRISFRVNDDNQFVTAVIPLELLWGPYAVFHDDEKIYFHEYINNGTHVWVNIRPDTAGDVTIIGTTVVPEFPIIAPLAVGFLIILVVPLIRKFNLH
ncbi:hypothetical protein [Nitrosopumilus sp.]|uniref:hypothetical protein n=1 Tax=Nitrosopumilus sp. TaxID=2024843 RepID=UPI00349FEBC0